jgi:hypothetical protein
MKECLTKETYIDTVLVEKMLQFKRPAARTVRIPAGEAQGFTLIRVPGLAAIFSHKEDNDFQDSPRTGHS